MRVLLVSFFCLSIFFACNDNIKKENDIILDNTSTESELFWKQLQSLCGKSFEGVLELPEDDEDFGGKKLVMHVRSCNDSIIKIPFFVGEDKSRTWILKHENDRISLKHDHRHEDGTDYEITMYGGITTNSGQASLQVFSADEDTRVMIPAASSNTWWITLDDKQFTYNLRRLDTERVFRVVFDVTKTIETPEAPWGWIDN